MDQSADKFNEISPVIELVYVMLTNMAKYLAVYAKDIDATKLEQYLDAKEALETAIKKFDALYGLETEELDDEDVQKVEDVEETEEAAPVPTPAPVPAPQAQGAQTTEEHPYDYASGADPESLKKAKQAVDELKALFADMKKKETELQETESAQVQQQQSTTPAPVQAPVMPPAPQAQQPVQMPSPMNTQQQAPASSQAAKDASEIDNILAELRKLQNKGNGQL